MKSVLHNCNRILHMAAKESSEVFSSACHMGPKYVCLSLFIYHATWDQSMSPYASAMRRRDIPKQQIPEFKMASRLVGFMFCPSTETLMRKQRSLDKTSRHGSKHRATVSWPVYCFGVLESSPRQ
jgi:hypothetical protein